MVNLLGNAAKFTPEGGHVETGWVRHERSGKPGCLFWVKDDGAGIPPQDLNRIFDKFYRLEAHLKRETGGSGLGLAICLKLVELHGGQIWAENNPEGGAVFKVFLPEASEVVMKKPSADETGSV
jgi:signal transduction histidine kinase